MRQLRIIHCIRAPSGGAFRHLEDLAVTQTAEGHEVGAICDSSPANPFDESRIADLADRLPLGVSRVAMGRDAAFADILAVGGVRKAVARLQPDILHGHGAKGGTYARIVGSMIRKNGKPLGRFYAPHGGSLHFRRASLKGRAYFAAEGAFERMTDGLIFVSAFEREAYSAKVGKPRVPDLLTVNGLREDEFEPVQTAPDAVDFLFIGALRDLKGPDVFLEAMALLNTEHGHHATAFVVGDGPDRDSLLSLAGELGLGTQVWFKPPMPARAAFALARTVVIPSRAESMPYIVLEAIAAGRPIVTTRVGGIPEIMAGEQQRLVPPGEPEALAAALAATIENFPEALTAAENRRDHARERFSLADMSAQVLEFYIRARPDLLL